MYGDYARKVWATKYQPIPGLSIYRAAQDVSTKEKMEEGDNKDTELRKNLQTTIIELARAGKSVSEIVKELTTNPEYEKYSKFEEYFVGYAENHVSKFGKPKIQKVEDSDQR